MNNPAAKGRKGHPGHATTADLETFDTQELLARSSGASCEALFSKADAAFRIEEDDSKRRILRFLVHILSMVLRPRDQEGGPLAGMIDGLGPTSFAPSELEVIDTLVSLPDLHLDVQARLLDIRWILKRGSHEDWRRTAVAYLEAARFAEHQGHRRPVPVRLERALQLARGFKQTDAMKAIGAYINQLIDAVGTDLPAPEHLALTRLARSLEGADVRALGLRCERWAEQSSQKPNIEFTRAIWETAADTYALGKELVAAEQRARLAAAETFVAQADRAQTAPHVPRMHEAHALEQAIHALRKIEGTKARRDELHSRLLAVQREVPAEYSRVEGPGVDLTELATSAIDAVAGLSFADSVVALAMLAEPPSWRITNELVAKQLEWRSMERLTSKVITDQQGRVIKRVPAIDSAIADEDDGMLDAVHEQARQHRGLIALGQLEPARQQIAFEHGPTVDTVAELIKDSPFIPHGRSASFARGIHAGFRGNWIGVAHYLIPQVENAIRQIVRARGGRVSTLTDEGIQNWVLLTPLLESAEALNAFGEDYLFALKSLLALEGSNLRNVVSHGISSDRELGTSEVLYFWWLILHLCLLPKVASQAAAATNQVNETESLEQS